MKVILNPPYSGNLHLKILREAMQHSDDIVNLSPIRWLEDPLAEYKRGSDYQTFIDIRERLDSLEELNVKTTNALFGIQMTALGIYHILRSAKTYETKHDVIIEKMLRIKDRVSDHVTTSIGKNFCQVLEFYGGNQISGSGWVKHPDYETRGSSTATSESTTVKGVNFKTRDEAINFYEAYKKKVFIYLWGKAFQNGRLFCGKFFPWLGDYTHPWTDSDLYAYFGLTPDEISIIEKEMAKYTC